VTDIELSGLYDDTLNISLRPIFAELFTFQSSMVMGGPAFPIRQNRHIRLKKVTASVKTVT
jgi:hypothetical protein